MSASRLAMSVIASSQLTGSNRPSPDEPLARRPFVLMRRNGVVTRSGSFTTSVNAMPFWQANPADNG